MTAGKEEDNLSPSFDTFLTDQRDLEEEKLDENKFIKPNIETKLSPKKRQDCRDIVLEIRKFGVSQRQLLYLIYLLSLELEDREIMNSLVKAVGENRDKIPVGPDLDGLPRLIIPDGNND